MSEHKLSESKKKAKKKDANKLFFTKKQKFKML